MGQEMIHRILFSAFIFLILFYSNGFCTEEADKNKNNPTMNPLQMLPPGWNIAGETVSKDGDSGFFSVCPNCESLLAFYYLLKSKDCETLGMLVLEKADELNQDLKNGDKLKLKILSRNDSKADGTKKVNKIFEGEATAQKNDDKPFVVYHLALKKNVVAQLTELNSFGVFVSQHGEKGRPVGIFTTKYLKDVFQATSSTCAKKLKQKK
jgi:hypothetical protein